MTDRSNPRISTRKEPKQARSAGLVADILQAASRVLKEEGAQRFTTARVAEKAGVSVGSLYQYFPNKAAILFRLQTDEWRETADLLHGILADPGKPPLERLCALVHAFLRSECEEAEMRVALGDSAPLYRGAPEARDARAKGRVAVSTFMREVLPKASESICERVGDLITDDAQRCWQGIFRRRSDRPKRSRPTRTPWLTCSAPTLDTFGHSKVGAGQAIPTPHPHTPARMLESGHRERPSWVDSGSHAERA